MRFLIDRCWNKMHNSATALAIALTYIPFHLAMQYSKQKWFIARPDTAWEFVKVLHSEASVYAVILLLVILGVRSVWGVYLILTSYYLLSFTDSIVWSNFGRPFHPKDIAGAVELFQYYREFFTLEAIGWKRMVYAAIPLLTGLTLALHWVKDRFHTPARQQKSSTKLRTVIVVKASLVMALFIALMPLVISRSYLHYNSMIRMAKQIYHDHRLATSELADADKLRLFGAGSALTTSAASKHYNVILYVLETAPSDFYPDMSLFLQPWAQRNGGTVHVTPEHYTTYPESDRSLLSMLTGNYPSLNRGSDWILTYDYGKPLPKILADKGYKTHLLSVAPLRFHNEDIMVKNLGFENVLESSIAKEAYARAERDKKLLDRTTLYDADLELLDQALKIIRKDGKDPYLMAFLPQASHAPYQTPPGYAGKMGQRELFDANARWQLDLMSRMMECLEQSGQAQNTLFIVAGDHGLRHPAETSLFPDQSTLSPLTFRVVFAFYSPQDPSTAMKQKVTSHIDITPTILETLGIGYEAEDYHGRSMLKPSSRTVFFLGGDYLPVSGFTSNGWYFMENINRDLVLKSPRFDFGTRSAKEIVAAANEQERSAITNDLEHIKGLLTRSAGATGRRQER